MHLGEGAVAQPLRKERRQGSNEIEVAFGQREAHGERFAAAMAQDVGVLSDAVRSRDDLLGIVRDEVDGCATIGC